MKMQTVCDECKKPVRDVGRLVNVKYGGFTQKVCKNCRKKLKISYR